MTTGVLKIAARPLDKIGELHEVLFFMIHGPGN